MAVYSTEGRCMIFHTSALSPKTTRTTQGVNVMSLKPKYRVEKALPLAQTPIRNAARYRARSPAHCGSPPSGARPGRGADDPAVTPPSRAAAAPPNQKRKGSFFVRTGKLWAAFRPYLWITLASAVFALGFDWCYVPNQITLGGMTGLGQIIHAIVPAIPVGSAVIALTCPCSCWAGGCWGGSCWPPPSSPPPLPPWGWTCWPPVTPSRPWTPCWPPSSAAR